MRIICLSHPLSENTPLYPGTPKPEISKFRSIEKGDSANSSNISVNVHTGTHIDLPLHFCKDGASLSDYPESEFLFYPTYCIDIKKNGCEPVLPGDFADLKDSGRDAEAILVRTGSGDVRENNNEYERDHPWVHPSLPGYLKEKFPRLKLFGLDAISISSPNYREEGRESHRRFLCEERHVILLEDAGLSGLSEKDNPFRLRIYPCFYGSIDASPVIALAETVPEDQN